ncbi:hypothetical protein BSKO_03622 [Bryopsis sp. KO-2023]|nr:hypothetical protein BSKO_03622 [Bryopsis sp. KO-2023]
MFKKIQRNIERKRDGKVPIKFRFEITIHELTGIPPKVDLCRVVWARGAKIQMTNAAQVHDGAAKYDGKSLAQVATVYKGQGNSMESKEYSFKIQVPQGEAVITVGKGVIDLGRHATYEAQEPKKVVVPVQYAAGTKPLGKGELHISVSSHMMKGLTADDGMTVMSGLSALSSPFDGHIDQDLSGFDSIAEQPSLEEKAMPTVLSGKLSGYGALGEPLENAQSPREDENEMAAFDSIKTGADEDEVTELRNRVHELEEQVAGQRQKKTELEKQLKEIAAKTQVDMDAAQRQIESEKAEKEELEAQLSKQIQSAGEDAVEEAVKKAVAVWDVRYQKLMDEMKVVKQKNKEEMDDLHEQLLACQEEAMKFENQLRSSERARENMSREKMTLEHTLMDASSDRLDLERLKNQLESEVVQIRDQLQKASISSNNGDDDRRIMNELIDAKIGLAELHESHTIIRHQLYKSRETNMLLASKMTRLETYLYEQRAGGRQ